MIVKTRYYALGPNHSAQEWASITATLAQGEKVGECVVNQTYLDTFDWAMCRAGLTLVCEEDDGLNLRIMTDGKMAKLPQAESVAAVPVWPHDLPPSPLRDSIGSKVKLRALLPLANVRSEQIHIHVDNKKGRTRLRLIVEVGFLTPSGPRAREVELGCRLRIECLQGGEKEFARTVSRFDGMNLTTQSAHFDKIMESVGKVPRDYSGKLTIQLEREMRADIALKAILLDQLNQIEVNIPGTIDNTDTEFLHDLRVAVRRSRSALGRLKGVLPPTVEARFAEDLKWIGTITTPVRDLDVYLMDYPMHRDKLSEEQKENLEPLYTFLCDQYEKARVQLLEELNSKRFKDFLLKWRQFLERPVPQRPTAPVAALHIGDIADHRIWKTYRHILSEGNEITDDTPAEALHDLRKTGKKLRYLLEFFVSLYPPKKVDALVKHLKGLQENLGDFQDLNVQADTLHQFSADMMAAGEKRPQVFMSMGVLVEGFMQKKVDVRKEFATRFAAFAAKDVTKAFRDLTGKNKRKKVALSAHIEE